MWHTVAVSELLLSKGVVENGDKQIIKRKGGCFGERIYMNGADEFIHDDQRMCRTWCFEYGQ